MNIYISLSNSSEGCAGAVKRILSKMEGVKSVDTNVDERTVIVSAEGVTADEMVEKLSKWSQASGKYVKIA
jgi:copper chaperone